MDRLIVAAACAVLLCGCNSSEPGKDAENKAGDQASQQAFPADKICAEKPLDEGNELQRKGPVPVPAALRGFVHSGRTMLSVLNEAGTAATCVDIQWYETVDRMSAIKGNRMIGFEFTGNEVFGYVAVDRHGKGEEIATGAKPVFSPSGNRMAAAEYTQSGFENFNGVGIWEIGDAGTRSLFEMAPGAAQQLPDALGWWVEGWKGEECLALSMAPTDQPAVAEGEDAPPREQLPRKRFQLKQVGATWRLSPVATGEACS